MAEEMKGAHWEKRRPRRNMSPVKYPWEQWLNGSMWLLIQGEDFHRPVNEFRDYIFAYVFNHDIKIKTMKHENGRDLYIKATRQTSQDGLSRSMHFRQLAKRRERLAARRAEAAKENEDNG